MAIVAGELEGPAAALGRIASLEAQATPDGELAADLYWFRSIYENGSESATPEALRALIDRHGWFGRLALAFDQSDRSPSRAEVVSGGEQLSDTLDTIDSVDGLIALIGLVIGIIAVAKFTQSGYECAFRAPAAGGSVYLEAFAVFLLGFAVVNLVRLLTFGLGVESTIAAYLLNEVLLWSLVLTIFYPIFRGVSKKEWAIDMGWHKGEGIVKEVAAGVYGWLAMHLLLFVSGIIVVFVRIAFGSGESEETSGFGMFEAPEGNTWMLFLVGIVGAVVWAPVVEESILRGALYRHLAGRMKYVAAVIISAVIFGIIHPYSTSGLFTVAVSGVGFALLREWRGSLIAPMVAHALHNFSVSLTQIVVLSMLGD